MLEKQARLLSLDEQNEVADALDRKQQERWAFLLGECVDVQNLGRVTFKAPEFDGDGGWINTDPLSWRQLRGKVVAIHFYAFEMNKCKRNYPWYKGWQKSFDGEQFVVLGIHTPETTGERDISNLENDIQMAKLTFPILIDNEKCN